MNSLFETGDGGSAISPARGVAADPMVAQPLANQSRAPQILDVGEGLRHCATAFEQQYLRDLETLDRIERQALYPEWCFFCAMGEIAAGRMQGIA